VTQIRNIQPSEAQNNLISVGQQLHGSARSGYVSALSSGADWTGGETADLYSGDPRRVARASAGAILLAAAVVPGGGEADAAGSGLFLGGKAAARQFFDDPAMRQAANKFFSGASSKSTDYAITYLGNGEHALEFFSPADSVGYGKRYVQTILNDGRISSEFRQSLGPDGLGKVTFVHGAYDSLSEGALHYAF